MKLSRFDWIIVGPGYLYNAPFVSQHLLYRLYNLDCSLLFSVEAEAVSTTKIDADTRTARTRTETQKPKNAYLHFSTSAETSLAELCKIPPLQISLLKTTERKWRLGCLIVSLEPWQLPSKRGLFLTDPSESYSSHKIDGTFYAVKTPGPLVRAPDLARETLDEVIYSCCKVSILNEKDGRLYDYDANLEWSLAALRLVHGCQSMYEAVLKRGAQ